MITLANFPTFSSCSVLKSYLALKSYLVLKSYSALIQFIYSQFWFSFTHSVSYISILIFQIVLKFINNSYCKVLLRIESQIKIFKKSNFCDIILWYSTRVLSFLLIIVDLREPWPHFGQSNFWLHKHGTALQNDCTEQDAKQKGRIWQ